MEHGHTLYLSKDRDGRRDLWKVPNHGEFLEYDERHGRWTPASYLCECERIPISQKAMRLIFGHLIVCTDRPIRVGGFDLDSMP